MAQFTVRAIPNFDALKAGLKSLSTEPVRLQVDATGLKGVSAEYTKIATAQAKVTNAEASLLRAQNDSVRLRQQEAAAAERTAQAVEKTKQAQEKTAQATEKTAQKQADVAKEAERTAQAIEKTKQKQIELDLQIERGKNGSGETEENLKKGGLFAGLMGDSISRIGAKMVVWQVFNAGISAMIGGFRDAIDTMKAVDDELVTIRKVGAATTEELGAIEAQAYKTASAYGVAADEYLAGVAAFARAGYKEQSSALAELAVKTQLVGDVDAETAQQFLLSVDAAYKYKGNIEALTKVLDGANEIDNKYATSIQKIAEGMGIVAPVAAQMGVSVEEQAAAIGTITAVTQRSGTEAARAYRALLLNIAGDTKTEIEDGVTWTAGEIAGLRDILKTYVPEAVAAADATGKIINPMEAIAGLSKAVQDGLLTEAELMGMVNDIGGKLRTSQLLTLVQSPDMYNSMLEDFRNAAGSADKEVENALDSWTRKTAILKNTWTEVISNTVDSGTAKGLLDFLTGALKAVGNLGNGIMGLGGILLLAKAHMKDYGQNAAAWMNNLANRFRKTKLEGDALKESNQALAGGLSTVGKVAGAVFTALSTVYTIYNSIRQKRIENWDKQIAAGAEAVSRSQSLLSAYATYDQLSGKLDEGTASAAQFKTAAESLTGVLADQGVVVDGLSGSYEDYAKALQEATEKELDRASSEAEAAEDAAEKKLVDAYWNSNNNALRLAAIELGLRTAAMDGTETDNTQSAEDVIRIYEKVLEMREELKDSKDWKYYAASDAVNELKPAVEGYESAVQTVNKANAVRKFADYLRENDILTQEDFDSYIESVRTAEDGSEGFKATLIAVAKEAFPQFAQEAGLSGDEAENYGEQVKTTAETLDDLYQKLSGVKGVFQDFADRGRLSYSALKSIQESFSDVAGIDEYISRLSQAGLTTEELQSIMGDLVIQEAEAIIQQNGLTESSQDMIAALLREIGVVNSDEVAMYLLSSASFSAKGGIDAARQAINDFNNASLDSASKEQAFANIVQAANRAMAAIWNVVNTEGKYTPPKPVEPFFGSGAGSGSSSGGGGGSGGGGSRASSKDTELERHKDIVSLLESELDVLEAQNKPVEDRIDKLRQIQDALHDQAEYLRSIGASQEDINKLSVKWWDAEKQIASLQKDLLNELKAAVQEQLEEADAAREEEEKAIDLQIQKLKDTAEEEDKLLKLEELRAAILEKQNDLLDAQRERTVRIYNAKTGQWEWVADQKKVDSAQEALEEAQKDLAEYEKELAREEEIRKLEDRKQWINDQYDALEESWKAILKSMEEPARGIGDILADIQKNGTARMKAAVDDVNGLLQDLANYIEAVVGDKTGGSFAGNGANGDYANDTVDYSALMDKASSEDEFWYWAGERDKKAEALGIDISTSGYRTNEEIYAQWLAGRNKPKSSGGSGGGAGGGSPAKDYSKDKTDYSALMDSATTKEEFDYWAGERLKKAAAQGIDISSSGFRDNDEIQRQWAAKKTYDQGGVLEGLGGIKATERDEIVLPPDVSDQMLSPTAGSAFRERLAEAKFLYGDREPAPPSLAGNISRTTITDHSGAEYHLGNVTLSENQAKSLTVYELAQQARTLSLHTNN